MSSASWSLRGSGAELVDVIDDQEDRPVEAGEFRDQALHEGLTVELRRRHERGQRSSGPPIARSSSTTDSQNRCGSCSSRWTETHAVRSARSAASIHERTSTVFPLPGDAETRVTPAAKPADRRSNSSGRATTDGTLPARRHRIPSRAHRLTPENRQDVHRPDDGPRPGRQRQAALTSNGNRPGHRHRLGADRPSRLDGRSRRRLRSSGNTRTPPLPNRRRVRYGRSRSYLNE